MEAMSSASSLLAPRAAAPRRRPVGRAQRMIRANAEEPQDRPAADDAAARIQALLSNSEKIATEKRVASQSVAGLLQQTQNALKDKACTTKCQIIRLGYAWPEPGRAVCCHFSCSSR